MVQPSDAPTPIMVGTGERRTIKTLAMYGDIINSDREPRRSGAPKRCARTPLRGRGSQTS